MNPGETYSKDGDDKYSFEIGPIRPPSEGGVHSLLLRPTRNCPWNRCKFCSIYKGKDFQIRKVEEIKDDIDAVKSIRDILEKGSERSGFAPRDCISVVSGWMRSGQKTAFLQDSNSLIMRTPQLVEVLDYLTDTFPSLERITSYARSKTLARKSLGELEKIRNAELKRLHVGLESGDDEVLKMVNKGVTAQEHIEAGKKAKKAGFELSEYVMPDLGGRERWEEHALNTAKTLNEINPDYVRMRPLVVRSGTELREEYQKDNFHLSSPHERLEEVRKMVEHLDISGKLCFDHRMNAWKSKTGGSLFDMSYEGYELPEEKDLVIDLIEEGLDVDESLHTDPRELARLSL